MSPEEMQRTMQFLLHQQARQLCARIGRVTFEHVPRDRNKQADRLSNVGMDGNAGPGR